MIYSWAFGNNFKPSYDRYDRYVWVCDENCYLYVY